MLANNVLSDPVGNLLHMSADQALLTPQFSKDIRLADLLRHTLDWWLDKRTRPTGEVVAYTGAVNMLDAEASPLIAAWDYVEAANNRAWLAKRIETLELLADFLVGRDVDGDGLVESSQTGNYGTLKSPMRADSAYNTINSGWKNAYCNAIIYRAFRCMADLEKQLGRGQRQAEYAQRAVRLKAAYVKTFENPKTGWLAWWRSKDGELHDLSSPMITSLAICSGLVEPDQGGEMLKRLWTKIEAVGFHRFDLGVPITLTPVRRGDYTIGAPGAYGVPARGRRRRLWPVPQRRMLGQRRGLFYYGAAHRGGKREGGPHSPRHVGAPGHRRLSKRRKVSKRRHQLLPGGSGISHMGGQDLRL